MRTSSNRPPQHFERVTLTFEDKNQTMRMTLTDEGRERIIDEGYITDRDRFGAFCNAIADFFDEDLTGNGWDFLSDENEDMIISDDWICESGNYDETEYYSVYCFENPYWFSLELLLDQGFIELNRVII